MSERNPIRRLPWVGGRGTNIIRTPQFNRPPLHIERRKTIRDASSADDIAFQRVDRLRTASQAQEMEKRPPLSLGYVIITGSLRMPLEESTEVAITPEATNPWGRDEYITPVKPGIVTSIRRALLPDVRHGTSLKKELAILGSAAAVAVVAETGIGIGGNIVDYKTDVVRSNAPMTEFKDQNLPMLENLNFGTSFNPDDFGSMKEALQAAKYFHDVLGIKSIRLGVEWDKIEKTVNGAKTYDFSRYKQVIDQWMNYGDTNITFNLGIKTFGWPEQKVPKQYRKMLKDIARNGGVVEADSPLAVAALQYEEAFFIYLEQHYTQEQLSKTEWQFENEAYNPFGENGTKVTMSDGYLMQSILNAAKHFPDAKYKVSSAGAFNVNQIENVFRKLHAINPGLRLEIAIGWYTDTPVDTFTGSANTMNWVVTDSDPLVVDGILGLGPEQLGGNSLHDLPEVAKEEGLTESVSEGEVTPWVGNDFSKPPSTLQSLQLLVLRTAKFLDTSKPYEVSLWRLPDLYKARNDPRYKKNIQEMFAFITMVNIQLKEQKLQVDTTTNVLENTVTVYSSKTRELVTAIFPKVTFDNPPRKEYPV